MPTKQEFFNPEGFSELYKLESNSFWFNSRNKLILYFLKKYIVGEKQILCQNNNQLIDYLEIGCGTGYVLQAVKNTFQDWNITGSELFEEGLSFARKRVKDVNLVKLNALEMIEKNKYSVIGAFDVLEHIKDDEKVLKNIFNALTDHGYGIITVPQHQSLWSKADEDACHCRRYSRKEMLTKLENSGFEIIRSTGFVSLLFPAMWLMRKSKGKTATQSSEKTAGGLKLPNILNAILQAIMTIERFFIKIGINFPFGGSLLVVFKKKL
jgi:ubiquinone/menaquinone biosynthesis C-methylase UbiE